MKRFIACLIAILLIANIFAQNKMSIRETFESNKWQWDEFYEKSRSAGIEDGFLVIKNSEGVARSVVEFPVDVDRNFKITLKFVPERVSSHNWFGVVYNYDDENNYNCFLIQEKKFMIINRVNGVSSISRQGGIILKSGKNKEVIVDMEKKGNKLIFTVDNMEVISITKSLKYNTFGCCVYGEGTLKVDEVILEQAR